MKNHLTLLSLCFVLTFYTYSSYSADDKCPDAFEDNVPVVDLKDITGGHYRTGKFNYERNEKREYVLSQDTPSILLGGGTYKQGTPLLEMNVFDRDFLLDFGKEVLSEDIPVLGTERAIYPKGMSVNQKAAIQKRLDVKFPPLHSQF